MLLNPWTSVTTKLNQFTRNGYKTHLHLSSFLKLDGNTCVDETFFGNDFNNYETFIHPALERCFQQYQKLSTILDQTQICDFHFNAIGYTCSLENVFLSDGNSSFAISGEHFDGMTNNEVEAVAFKGSNLLTIPPEILLAFQKQKSFLPIIPE